MNLNQTSSRALSPSGTVPAAWLNSKIVVNASQRQDTAAGRLLCGMYLGTFIDDTLLRDEYSGYNHNGGEHTFRLHMTPVDVAAFLDLVQDRFARHDGMVDFVRSVKKRAVEKYPHLAGLLSVPFAVNA